MEEEEEEEEKEEGADSSVAAVVLLLLMVMMRMMVIMKMMTILILMMLMMMMMLMIMVMTYSYYGHDVFFGQIIYEELTIDNHPNFEDSDPSLGPLQVNCIVGIFFALREDLYKKYSLRNNRNHYRKLRIK